jgi:hypothetical protein
MLAGSGKPLEIYLSKPQHLEIHNFETRQIKEIADKILL